MVQASSLHKVGETSIMSDGVSRQDACSTGDRQDACATLILMDELMNYVSRNRKSGFGAQLYNFLQNLSECSASRFSGRKAS